MTMRQDRWLVCAVAALLAALWLVAPAVAQPRARPSVGLPNIGSGSWFGDSERDRVMANVHLGFANASFAGRWTPVRVTLVSTDFEGYEGLVRVLVTSDSGTDRYEVPFALPPGAMNTTRREAATVFVGFVAGGLYQQRYSLEIEVIGRPLGTTLRPSVLQRAAFGRVSRSATPPMPATMERVEPGVLIVGESSAGGLLLDTNAHLSTSGGNYHRMGRGLVQFNRAMPHDLPFPASRWMLYDGYDAVLIGREALGASSEAQRETLRRWVDFGGHLVIVDDLLGVGTRDLLPDGMLGATIGGDPSRGGAMGRVSIMPTPEGRANGWSSLELPGMLPGSAASGPVGLGWLTVLSRDPGAEREIEELHAIWQNVFRLESLLITRSAMSAQHHGWYRYGNSADMYQTQRALDHAAHTMAVRPISAALIGFLVFGIGLLIAVGTTFGDWFLLRTPRRRRLSFVTALGWLAAGSLIALLVPMLLRAGETIAVRMQVIDVNEANGGVASSEIFAIAAGRRQRFAPPGQDPQAWTRIVTATQRGGTEWTGSDGEQFAGNLVRGTVASLWTFHGALSESVGQVPGIEPEAMDLGAEIEIEPATDEPMLALRNGLGRIAGGQIFIAFQLRDRGSDAGDSSGSASGIASLIAAVSDSDRDRTRHRIGLRTARPNPRTQDGCWTYGILSTAPNWRGRDSGVDAVLLSGLPGASLRTAGIHAALGTGRFAVVTMKIEPSSERIAALDAERFAAATEPAGLIDTGMVHRWVRILVPIDEPTHRALIKLHAGQHAAEGTEP